MDKVPCKECGHGADYHTGNAEGLCLECDCMGWVNPFRVRLADSSMEMQWS